MKRLVFGACLLIFSAGVVAQRIDVDVQDERQRDSYMVGMDIVAGLRKMKDVNDLIDVRIVAQTIVDLLAEGKKPLLTEEEALTTRKAFVAKVKARNGK